MAYDKVRKDFARSSGSLSKETQKYIEALEIRRDEKLKELNEKYLKERDKRIRDRIDYLTRRAHMDQRQPRPPAAPPPEMPRPKKIREQAEREIDREHERQKEKLRKKTERTIDKAITDSLDGKPLVRAAFSRAARKKDGRKL